MQKKHLAQVMMILFCTAALFSCGNKGVSGQPAGESAYAAESEGTASPAAEPEGTAASVSEPEGTVASASEPEGTASPMAELTSESTQAKETGMTQATETGTTQATETGTAQATETGTAQVAETGRDEYREVDVQIFEGELTDRTVPLRFYKETPNVPYMGIGAYFDLMLGGGLTVEARGNGKYMLTNAAGAAAEVDVPNGIVSLDDLPSFENYLAPAKAGMRSSFKDSSAPYLRLRSVEYLDEPQKVTLDFGGCGYTLYAESAAAATEGTAAPTENGDPASASTVAPAEGDDPAMAPAEVYFPLSALSTWLSDIAQNMVSYNGQYLYVCRHATGMEQDRSYYNTPYYNGIVSGQPRESDFAASTYADLCFIFRYMYGYPGTAALDTGILKEKGFDEALTAYGEEGSKYREQLTSQDFRQFWLGMRHIDTDLLCDGHNRTELTMDLGDPESIERQKYFLEFIWESLEAQTMSGVDAKLMNTSAGIMEKRPEEMEREHYRKCGDTAVIFFNSFSVDEQGWTEYYKNGGLLPEDTMGIVASGLQKAKEDGEIRNIVFDVSSNLGGYTDSVMGILSLMTGKDYLAGYNELSRQKFRVYFDVDRNLDGVFDEKDKEVRYDFNYAALTSGASFSCGNLFPFLVQEAGGMLIGARTGGGCCSVQTAVLSEGFDLRISGYKFKLCDDAGSDLEAGAAPDIELEVPTVKEEDPFTGEEREVPDYSAYGDLDGICKQVSGWFAK